MAREVVQIKEKTRYIRQQGKPTVFVWTPALAVIPGMFECTKEGNPLRSANTEVYETPEDDKMGPLTDLQRVALTKLTKESVKAIMRALNLAVEDNFTFSELKKQLGLYLRRDNRVADLNNREKINLTTLLESLVAAESAPAVVPAAGPADEAADETLG